jgi:2-polyprenyl-3-methyl-5-hydroxy-6-metoxy-1,4-benzoquinol methylase
MYKDEYYEKASAYMSSQLKKPPEDIYRLALSLKKRVSLQEGNTPPRSLDVGCGAGSAVAAFKKAGWNAVGIDFSKKAVEAGRTLGLELHSIDLRDVEPKSFDVVTAFHVLEHCSSPRAFVRQCAACLASGGVLLLDVPNYGCHNSRRLREQWPYLYADLHLYQFTMKTLRRYLESSGFRVVSVRRLGGYGPVEDYGSVPGRETAWSVKKSLQEFRHAIALIPGAKSFLRWLIWHALGYGEFIRIVARIN